MRYLLLALYSMHSTVYCQYLFLHNHDDMDMVHSTVHTM